MYSKAFQNIARLPIILSIWRNFNHKKYIHFEIYYHH